MVKRMLQMILIFFLLIPFPAVGKVLDSVVGVVNGDVITLSDLDDAMSQYGKANIPNEGNPLDKEIKLRQARKEVLELIIEERLLLRVADRFGITVNDEEIDTAIARMKQQANASDDQMKKELTEQGFSLEGYRHFLKVQLTKVRIIEATIKSNVSMAEEKIREYHQKHAENYFFPEVRVSQILAQVPSDAKPQDWETAKKKMERIARDLRKGIAFEEVASRYSDDTSSAPSGGNLGFFKKGEMIPALEAVVFAMETGEVSRVIQSSQGLHVLKVTDRRAGSLAPFEEVKERVMADYYEEEVNRLYTKWLKDLKNRAKVEVKL